VLVLRRYQYGHVCVLVRQGESVHGVVAERLLFWHGHIRLVCLATRQNRRRVAGFGLADTRPCLRRINHHLRRCGVAAATGFLLAKFTDAAYPYIDSATTYAAIWATFLVARKILENWWYWLAIDAVSVFIYWARGLEATAVLFVVYVVLIPIGLVAWTRSWRQHHVVAVPG
jgi:hypothetical protein